jgi:RecA-family ATPase
MLSAKDWMDIITSRPQVPDLIEELLADAYGDFVLLAGRTGIGKTNLALHLAFCLATGTPFYGLKCQKTTVGYVGFEGTARKMADRLAKIGANFPEPGDNFRFHLGPPLILGRRLSEFKKLVAGCRVIILDPLRYLVDGDYCKPKDAIDFITLLRITLTQLRAMAIICHHIKKPNKLLLMEPGDLYQMKGAAEYADTATSVLMLERTPQKALPRLPHGHLPPVDPDAVTLYFAKHRDAVGELQPISLRFNRATLLFEKVDSQWETVEQ